MLVDGNNKLINVMGVFSELWEHLLEEIRIGDGQLNRGRRDRRSARKEGFLGFWLSQEDAVVEVEVDGEADDGEVDVKGWVNVDSGGLIDVEALGPKGDGDGKRRGGQRRGTCLGTLYSLVREPDGLSEPKILGLYKQESGLLLGTVEEKKE